MKGMEYPFTWLARNLFAWRQRMKYFLLRACVRTSEFKILWRHLAHYVQEMYVYACSTCRSIISPDSTNHMTHLRCCCSRRRFVNLSIFKRSLTRVHKYKLFQIIHGLLPFEEHHPCSLRPPAQWWLTFLSIVKFRLSNLGWSSCFPSTNSRHFISKYSCDITIIFIRKSA